MSIQILSIIQNDVCCNSGSLPDVHIFYDLYTYSDMSEWFSSTFKYLPSLDEDQKKNIISRILQNGYVSDRKNECESGRLFIITTMGEKMKSTPYDRKKKMEQYDIRTYL